MISQGGLDGLELPEQVGAHGYDGKSTWEEPALVFSQPGAGSGGLYVYNLTTYECTAGKGIFPPLPYCSEVPMQEGPLVPRCTSCHQLNLVHSPWTFPMLQRPGVVLAVLL